MTFLSSGISTPSEFMMKINALYNVTSDSKGQERCVTSCV